MLLVSGGIFLKPYQSASASHEQIVTATYVKKAPAGLNDKVWQNMPGSRVFFNPQEKLAGRRAAVSIKSVYTDKSLYFLLKWNDPTRSMTYKTWNYDGKNWNLFSGGEDRITLLFEISRIHKFATKGCVVTCHGPGYAPEKEWTFATKTSGEIGDLWDWRAAATDPYKYAADDYLTVTGNWDGYAGLKKTGRRKDNGNGGALINQTNDKSKPLYMPDSTRIPSAPAVLLMKEAFKIPDYSIFKAGDQIPALLLQQPTGSRYDVKAASHYADGRWTVMLFRRLDTGHDHDVVFNPLKHYSLAMALFDGSVNYYVKAEALSLYFAR